MKMINDIYKHTTGFVASLWLLH